MISLSYKEYGQGHPVVLLHGFPMNKRVWEDFAGKLSMSYHVIAIDLPGFGESEDLQLGFTLSDVADHLLSFLSTKNIENFYLIGHSLGGYVALALAEKNPKALDKLVLFHSTAFPDSEEKKSNRNKVLDFVDQQGVIAFTSNFIAPLFYDQSHASIPLLKSITTQASLQAVKGYTAAMRDRQDMIPFLKTFSKPVLFLGGEKDSGIPPDSLHQQASINSEFKVKIMSEVAHMGMFEQPEQSLQIIKDFFKS